MYKLFKSISLRTFKQEIIKYLLIIYVNIREAIKLFTQSEQFNLEMHKILKKSKEFKRKETTKYTYHLCIRNAYL